MFYINGRCSPPRDRTGQRPAQAQTRAQPPPPGGPAAGAVPEVYVIPSPARIRGTIIAWAVRPEDLSALRLFHKALADVNRLRIVQRLASEPATVTELIDTCGLSQPLVSHHLRRLREAGLVVVERHGRESVCHLRPETFTDLIAREREILGYDRAPRTTATAPDRAGEPESVSPAALPLPETSG